MDGYKPQFCDVVVAECETIYTKRNKIEEVVLWSVYYKNKIVETSGTI